MASFQQMQNQEEYLNGFVSTDNSGAKVYEFYKTEYKEAWEDEDGQHDAGYYFIDDDPEYCRYYAVASNNDADGAAYSMGWCCNTRIECDADPSGISNVKTTAKSNVKTYNLMGQEVNASAKGLNGPPDCFFFNCLEVCKRLRIFAA